MSTSSLRLQWRNETIADTSRVKPGSGQAKEMTPPKSALKARRIGNSMPIPGGVSSAQRCANAVSMKLFAKLC
jgi:hypothetical protein